MSAPTIISRADAKAAGLKRYFTGKPCKRGHVTGRWCSNAHCVKCSRIAMDIYYAKPLTAERYRVRHRAHRRGVEAHEIPPKPDDSRCECCGVIAPLVWDHDHDLEKLGFPKAETHRGWLCDGCNTGIGRLGDNVQGLTRALRYIRRALTGSEE